MIEDTKVSFGFACILGKIYYVSTFRSIWLLSNRKESSPQNLFGQKEKKPTRKALDFGFDYLGSKSLKENRRVAFPDLNFLVIKPNKAELDGKQPGLWLGKGMLRVTKRLFIIWLNKCDKMHRNT